MKTFPQILPTPAACSLNGKTVFLQGFFLANACPSPRAESLLKPYLLPELGLSLRFCPLKKEKAQAYELRLAGTEIQLSCSDPTGCLYAVQTLLQLLVPDGENGGYRLPEGHIVDYPRFAYRGVNWNLQAECRGWSQDDSRGKADFLQRSIAGLDLLVQYKLNWAMVDGFGWNPRRFPGYQEMMRQLNAEARQRGIHLCFGGYSASYETQSSPADGPAFLNRLSYPDGEPYACMALPGQDKLQYAGTCLANPELLRLKCDNLQTFVQAVEPGALYIHGLDISSQENSERIWARRCALCREKYPSDDVRSVQGLAGALADNFNALFEAISSVRNPQTGYNAARDCLIHMVGPNYTRVEENDAAWQYHLDYFANIFKLLKHPEIFLMLREQFFSEKMGPPRFAQLRQRIGPQARISCIYFPSGTGFYDSSPIAGDAPFITLFDGMDAVICGNGNAFQETRQVVNAEYLWSVNSAYAPDFPRRATQGEFMPVYDRFAFSTRGPNCLFGKTRLFRRACSSLYGAEAGKLVAEAQLLRSRTRMRLGMPSRVQAASAYTVPLLNASLPNFIFSNSKKIRWQEKLLAENRAEAGRMLRLCTELSGINRQAVELLSAAAALSPRKDPLLRLARTAEAALEILQIILPWLRFFTAAYDGKAAPGDSLPLQDRLQNLLARFASRAEQAADPRGTDFSYAVKLLRHISGELERIEYSLNKPGEYLPVQELIRY